MVKLIPKNPILGSFVGVFLGFFIPACDCAVIPVSKRLIKKKVFVIYQHVPHSLSNRKPRLRWS